MNTLNTSTKAIILVVMLLVAALPGYSSIDKDIEKKVENTFKKLSQDEKFSLIASYRHGVVPAMPKYGIAEMKVPQLAKGGKVLGSSMQYPAPVTAASTWNRRLMYGLGMALAGDAKKQGGHMLPAPNMQVLLTPLCDENYNYMSENPYLCGEMAGRLLDGVMAGGGVAIELNNVGASTQAYNSDSVAKALKMGMTSMSMIDAQVRNILRFAYVAGKKQPNPVGRNVALSSDQRRALAQAEAEEGLVLLKNEKNILPLKKVKTLMVTGPFAEVGDEGVASLAAGLKKELPKVQVKSQLLQQRRGVVPCRDLYASRGGRESGLKAEYYHNATLGGKPLYSEQVPNLNFDWSEGSPNVEILGKKYFSARYTGYLRVPQSGEYTLVLTSSNCSRLWLDGDMVVDNWGAHEEQHSAEVTLQLIQNRDYALRVDYAYHGGVASLDLGYRKEEASSPATATPKWFDAVVVTAGFEKETAGNSWQLPASQVATIKKAAQLSPNVVVVLYAGSAVDVSQWIDDVKAVVYAGYPGQEGGTAVARLLAGKVVPCGRLTTTWAHSINDYSRAMGASRLSEHGKAVRYPLGYGLSYTQFCYSNMKVNRKGKVCEVKVDVQNVGKVTGAEVVQAYVHLAGSEAQKSLQGFDKITLKPGQKKTVTLLVPEEAFSIYHAQLKRFLPAQGTHTIQVGASSRDIRLSAPWQVNEHSH